MSIFPKIESLFVDTFRFNINVLNSNTSSKTLEKLSNDEKWRVRDCVAQNPNTPEYLKFYLYFNS